MYLYSYLSTHGISGLATRGDCQQLEVHLKMTKNMYSPSLSPPPIEWTRSCTGRPWSSEFGHALGGGDRVNSEMHSELWSSVFRDALSAGYDRGRWEENLEVVDLEAVDGRRARCWDSIDRLVNPKLWEWALMKSWEWRDDRQSEVYAVLGVCCTRRMLHSADAALGVCCTRRMLQSVLTHDDGMER